MTRDQQLAAIMLAISEFRYDRADYRRVRLGAEIYFPADLRTLATRVLDAASGAAQPSLPLAPCFFCQKPTTCDDEITTQGDPMPQCDDCAHTNAPEPWPVTPTP